MNSGINVCNSLVLENCDTVDWHGLSVEISGQYIKDSVSRFELLKRRQSVQVKSIKIEPDYRILCEITEAVKTTFLLVVKSMEVILYKKEYPITLLSFEEWAGSNVLPEHIAAFVVPNNPLLSKIKLSAAKFMEKWTGSAAFDEYQTLDRNRVRAQVAAVYEALRTEGIIYSAPPVGFEKNGLRVRLADRALNEKMGSSLDLSLLVASCLSRGDRGT